MRAYLARKWQEKSREFESPSIHRGVSHGNQKCGKDLCKVGFGANFGGSVRTAVSSFDGSHEHLIVPRVGSEQETNKCKKIANMQDQD